MSVGMHPRRFFAAVLLLVATSGLLWHVAGLARTPRPTPDRTNSPPKNSHCGISACHGTLGTPAQGGVAVDSGVPNCYEPGVKYVFRVTVSDSTARRWGFSLSVQYQDTTGGKDTTSAGTLATLPGQRTGLLTSDDGMRKFVSHDSIGGDGTYPGRPSAASWRLSWTAPAAGSGPVCIYVAGLGSDNDSTRAGDRTYLNKKCIQQCGATPTRRSTWGALKRYFGDR